MQTRQQAEEELRSLAARGVQVAAGRGTTVQRLVTASTLVGVLVVLGYIAPGNPALWWMLPVALLVIDFLSGVVHWAFDTRIRPGSGLLGRIAVNFLDHHVHPRRSADVGFAATTWRVALYLSLPPEHHRRHHRDHSQAYCVFTGWWNPLLDRIGFWEKLSGFGH